MKKLVFIVFVLILLTTSVYAFSIKDTLTGFSINDFIYSLFHKDTVGINVKNSIAEKSVEATAVNQNVPINPVSPNSISGVSNQQNIQLQSINQESLEEIPDISSEQIQQYLRKKLTSE